MKYEEIIRATQEVVNSRIESVLINDNYEERELRELIHGLQKLLIEANRK